MTRAGNDSPGRVTRKTCNILHPYTYHLHLVSILGREEIKMMECSRQHLNSEMGNPRHDLVSLLLQSYQLAGDSGDSHGGAADLAKRFYSSSVVGMEVR